MVNNRPVKTRITSLDLLYDHDLPIEKRLQWALEAREDRGTFDTRGFPAKRTEDLLFATKEELMASL
jgi:hypothetical protein